ncbi:oxidative stress transcriptional regulator AosR [Mycolicibacterium thermoresistibile]|uniref:Uncharacterized protein n=2 Tax=Mycolicibacterium thermoresistibile TaxID=1797 RepID=G7CL07_MYCT3|nr:DUF2017 domain-containing protein [Mycolicibacterium thermoresistibile]EHI11814.1 hypothetical protein KEK_12983 [Mycolicibacterium thermoresistibile ATCC 19527]MCV7187971.1 DUF2017 domain-containing protein [Mycolicibacterium thermoresistibile]GAT15221.1 protein of unknown function [Mycolicibacterium thermoresistibile]SNW19306.1 protein of uncharacterised function (DUF2017) [Mycolicibacterium thermoresistibile]
MRLWKRVQTASGPRFRSALESHEATLLRNLTTSLLAMLEERESSAPRDELAQLTGMRTGHTTPPPDATLQRLLPDFHRPPGDDPDSADAGSAQDVESLNSALRSLHEPQILDAKRQSAEQLLQTLPERGGKVDLSEAEAEAWAAAVNDIRLALGTMLGVGPEGPERLPDDHPLAGHHDVYQWLTVLQEYLVLGLLDRPGR